MKKVLIISSLLLISRGSFSIEPYEKIFPDDFKHACNFLEKNTIKFKSVASKYKQNLSLLKAVVFPEIMRYSVLNDVLETSALEYLYVHYGSEAADFSIGYFQMKPSFIETIERDIACDRNLSPKYDYLLFKKGMRETEKRKIRLQRLKKIDWQIVYLSAFIAICDSRFEAQKFMCAEDKIIFYSTAYNSGFHQSAEKIIAKSALKTFPYGIKYTGEQYAYSDIALYFHLYSKTTGNRNSPQLTNQ